MKQLVRGHIRFRHQLDSRFQCSFHSSIIASQNEWMEPSCFGKVGKEVSSYPTEGVEEGMGVGRLLRQGRKG